MDDRSKVFMAALAIVMLLYTNTIEWMIGSWIYNPYYSHGFLVLAISMYTLRKSMKDLRGDGSSLGLTIVALALAVHVLSSAYDYNYISATTLPFAVFGLVATFYGLDTAKKFAFPIFFLLFAVPYPIYSITNVLEVFSAETSVRIVNALGFKACNVGAEIHLSSISFVVGAPCSGIRSIMALMTVSALYAYLIRDSIHVKVALLLLAVPLAMLANILRIVSILVTAELFGRDVALNIVHYASDVIFFIVAVLALMGLRRCLSWMSKARSR